MPTTLQTWWCQEWCHMNYQVHKSCDFDFYYDRLYDISKYLIIETYIFKLYKFLHKIVLYNIIKDDDNDI